MQQGSDQGEGTTARGVNALRALVAIAGLLPWALALGQVHAPAIVLSFHTLCHQLPDRTMSLLGAPMVVCSRCAGIYAGVALGVLLPLPRARLAQGRHMVLWATLVMLADVLTQDLGLHAPWHPVRLATGLALGWAASAFMFGTLAAPRGSRAELAGRSRAG